MCLRQSYGRDVSASSYLLDTTTTFVPHINWLHFYILTMKMSNLYRPPTHNLHSRIRWNRTTRVRSPRDGIRQIVIHHIFRYIARALGSIKR